MEAYDNLSTAPQSLAPLASAGRSRKSVTVGAVAGGAVVAILLAAVVVIAALRRGTSSDSSGPAKDNDVSQVPNGPDSTATASNSASLPTTSMPVTKRAKSTSVARGDIVLPSSQHQRYQISAQDLHYKDQARHVPVVDARAYTSTVDAALARDLDYKDQARDVPLVDARAHGSNVDADQKPAAIANHSVASAETRNSRESESTGRRRAIDP
jgi:hypothetical protein